MNHWASSGTDRFKTILEAKIQSDMTSILIGSRKIDYGLIDLLVEAGEDVKAVKNDGCTACRLVTLAESNPPNLLRTFSKYNSFIEL